MHMRALEADRAGTKLAAIARQVSPFEASLVHRK
jgi:hypothetical protein